MQKLFLLTVISVLLSACAAGQVPPHASIPNVTEAPLQTQPTVAAPTQAVDSSAAAAMPAVEFTATAKPPLAKDAWMQMPAVPTGVSNAMKAVYQRGLAMGNDPTHFSVIGDCQNVSSYFMSTFDKPGDYSLGPKYAYLESTIAYYQGSYSHVSKAVKGGYNVAAVLSPLRADPKSCNPNESPLDCELRTWRPSIVFVSMETWWSKKPAAEYEKYMRQVLNRIIASGAVPIIATKADNLEGDNSINATVAELAYEYDIPLWNFWAAVHPLSDHGISPDGFHLTFDRNFFDNPNNMLSAWPWRNLTALQTLDVVHKALVGQP